MSTKLSFVDAVKERRTNYQLENNSPIPDSAIEELCKTALKYVPSSFNSQTTRLVLLVKAEHEKLWDFTLEILRAIVPAEAFSSTEEKIKGFRAAYGTILFFEDPEPTKELQTKFAAYADKFPQWSEHTSAMHQFFLWTALEAEGFGANLQHYNPLIDEKVKAEWGIGKEYKLLSQLVFGTPKAPPGPRPELVKLHPIEYTFKSFGGSDSEPPTEALKGLSTKDSEGAK